MPLMRYRIWVSEVAAGLTNAEFDAVDISADQFPPEPFRAPNVRFWTHNCFEPIPDEYLGKFDIVNARFWLCIVNDDVADKLLDNFLTLLSKLTASVHDAKGLSSFRTRWLSAVVRTAA
jgi:chemotaxis methyl-accepting protein methylase